MLGFLARFALLGLATAAWPIYLHLRKKREKTVQVVPSLRLFLGQRIHSRRKRIQQLGLLLARVGILLTLFLLISQPYLESERDLPLPLIAGSNEPGRYLGILVDDSLSAFHGETASERLESSRAWLLELIDRLPDVVRISVVTTSHAQPTGFLTREQARTLVERMRAIPRPGDGAEALSSLAGKLSERRGALIVAAPRTETLWLFDEKDRALREITRLHFFDTSSYRTDAFLAAVTRQWNRAGRESWMCELAGSQEMLSGSELRCRRRNGDTVFRRELSIHEALQRRVRIDAAELPEDGYEITLESTGSAAHPWR